MAAQTSTRRFTRDQVIGQAFFLAIIIVLGGLCIIGGLIGVEGHGLIQQVALVAFGSAVVITSAVVAVPVIRNTKK